MEKNYAYQSGAFMAMAKMFRDAVRDLDTAEDEWDRKWARQRLDMLSEQTNELLVELGYEEELAA
jgi:hypothetical protein